MTFGASCEINTTVNGSSMVTTQEWSADYNGVTFFFDKQMPVGSFVTGEPFVVSDQAFQITSISPASGDLGANGYIGNGAMQDPWLSGDLPQGFDGYMGTGNPSADIPYLASSNVDPAASGSLALGAGQKTSIVKSVRAAGAGTGGNWQTVEKYVVLSVLDQAPPVGAYRPGVSGSAKVIRTQSDVDFTARGSVLPASFPSVATMLAEVPPFAPMFHTNGERRRRLRLDASYNTANSNYSGDLVKHYGRLVYALNSTAPTAAERQQIIDRIMVFANDLESSLQVAASQGASLGAGAGQGGGMWLWGMAAAALTKDDALLQSIHSTQLQPTKNGFWVSAGNIGSPAGGKSSVEAQTYFSEHIGIPHIEPDEAGSHHGARYLNLGADIAGWEQAAILAFQQGPPGKPDGRAMILNGGPNDTSNQLAATHNFLSRWYRFDPPVKPTGGPSSEWKDVWDQLLGLGAATAWTGIPDQPPKGNSLITDANGYFSVGSGAGEIDLDDRSIDYATEAITQTDVRYSLDGVQWVEIADVALAGGAYTISGLLRGAAHHVGWRRHSASGASPWSANFPYAKNDPDAEVVTTTGSEAAAAPVSTVAPVICYRPHPGWEHAYWLPSAATVGIDDVELAAGVGYWSGYPAPGFTFQWKRDGVPIAGATGQTYNRVAADADTALTCDVTATNGSGAQMVTTGAVTCPPLTSVPSTTLMDTEFRGAFAIDYETELAAIVTDDATAVHEPTQSLGGLTGLSFGALRCDKTGSKPSLDLPLRNAAVAGTVYDIVAQVATSWSPGSTNGFTGTLEFSVRNASDTQFFTAALNPANNTSSELLNIVGSFAVPGGETDLALYVRVRNTAPEGGSGRGDPMLHRLTITAAA